MKIAILGWGSLLWDERAEFDAQHEKWQCDGPYLKLEFSRVSETRSGALTLVLDYKNGEPCQVAYALSKRKEPDDAICDLRCREGTILKHIGFYFADGSRKQSREPEALKAVEGWAANKRIDTVIWTDLPSNFEAESKCKKPFTIDAALCHIQALDLDTVGKAKAAEYVWRAPNFINTPLRKALQSQPWFKKPANEEMPPGCK